MTRLLCLLPLLVVLASGGFRAGVAESATTDRYALLIGVTKYPYLGKAKGEVGRYDLSGPTNDMETFHKVLTGRFGFVNDDKHVRVLTEEAGQKDAKWLPERANIEREFKRLATPGLLKPGDQVVIVMGGHGSQQPADWSIPDNFEPDGLDELFMPRDVKDFDEATERYPNAITDDQLREWIDAIVKTEALVWITLDSCHSGTMLREIGKEKFRQVRADKNISSAALQKARAEGEKRFGSQANPSSLKMWPDSPKVAAIYAAQPQEVTLEMEMPGVKGGQVRGLLSSVICEILNRPSTRKMTYDDLVREIHARYSAMGRSFPTPMAEGKLCDRGVLTFEKGMPQRPPIVLTQSGDQLRIDAGRIQGLTTDSVLAVYPRDADRAKARPAGYVRVEALDLSESGVQAVERVPQPKDKTAPRFQAVAETPKFPSRAFCELVEVGTEEFLPAVALDRRTAEGEPLPEAMAGTLAKDLRALAEAADAPVRLVEKPDNAWLLQVQNLKSGQLHLLPPDRAVNTVGPLKGKPVRYGPVPDGQVRVAWLRERFGRISRASNLIRCVATLPDASEQEDDDTQVKVAFQLQKVGKETSQKDLSASHGARQEGFPGDRFRARVTNMGREDLFFSILVVTADNGIKCLFPREPGTNNRLSPGQSYPLPIRLKSTNREEIDRFLLIATKAGRLRQGSTFIYLEQPSLEAATRDPAFTSTKLDSFLLSTMFAHKGGSRDVEVAVSNCTMKVIECRTKPRP